MTDDLVKRLRAWDGSDFDDEAHEAADRIEALERDYAEACNEAADCYLKQCVSDTRLAKAVEALRVLLATAYTDDHAGWQDALKEATAVMAEIEGEKKMSDDDPIRRGDVLAEVERTSHPNETSYAPYLYDRIAALPAVTAPQGVRDFEKAHIDQNFYVDFRSAPAQPALTSTPVGDSLAADPVVKEWNAAIRAAAAKCGKLAYDKNLDGEWDKMEAAADLRDAILALLKEEQK